VAQTSVCSLNDAYTDWSLCYSATRYRAVVLTSLACGVINDSAKANARDWVRLRLLMCGGGLCPAVSLAVTLGCAPGAGLGPLRIASRVIFFRLTDAELGARASEFCCIEIRRHVHLTHRRAKPAPGAQPVGRVQCAGGAQPPPHIRRRSRATRGLSRRTTKPALVPVQSKGECRCGKYIVPQICGIELSFQRADRCCDQAFALTISLP